MAETAVPTGHTGAVTSPPELHPDLAPLAFLLGTWSGGGEGEYPTIEPFSYRETVTFAHVGKPFVAYGQRTADPATGVPMHAETGYLRVVGAGRVELVIAQPTGVVELHEGTVAISATGGRLDLRSTAVVCTATAKEVTEVTRAIEVDGDRLRYRLAMAAVGQPLTHHLAAELVRQ
jgi:hypothetical protein